MRDNGIDILRFIGLSMIILAHVEPPSLLFQIRNFDVPLMVLVSGLSFSLSYKKTEKYYIYLWKRVKRLLFPVWIFLTLYFMVLYIFVPTSSELTLFKLAASYSLIGGIGYVWVIRIFLMVAALSPLLYLANKKIKSNLLYFFIILVGLIINDIVIFSTKTYINGDFLKLISLFTLYVIPYSMVFAIGLRLTCVNRKQSYALCLSSLVSLLLSALAIYIFSGELLPTQKYKYPPTTYYISYALLISFILWMNIHIIESLLRRTKLLDFVLFCGRNSIWIYLWHIVFIKTITASFEIKFFLVMILAALITYIQVYYVKMKTSKLKNINSVKNINTLFTG
jgi:fucose 4-O-acetylase-like acetyltransferase